MNIVDALVLVITALAAFRGFRRGLLGQAFELGGGFIGLLLGIALGPRIADAFTSQPTLGSLLLSLLVVFLCMSLGQAAGYVAGHRFGSIARRAQLGGLDSFLGAAFGIAVILVSYWLIGSMLVQAPIRPLARALQRSELLRTMNDISEPPDVLAYLRQYLVTSDFPQVFTGLPPEIAPPVKLPSGSQARAAVRAAAGSTVRLEVPACGGMQLGTGWVAAASTVVTNAHVVAGGDEVSVHDPESGTLQGTVVSFDDDTDVAVLHVEGLSGDPLPLETDVVPRGTPGATLGYPGAEGGRLVPSPAAVQANVEARGKDIYGRDDVTRDVYELRAHVQQGDSGGPFVLPNGRVAGVIFAASTTDGRTGYALIGREVVDDIDRGSERADPVSTGRCTH